MQNYLLEYAILFKPGFQIFVVEGDVLVEPPRFSGFFNLSHWGAQGILGGWVPWAWVSSFFCLLLFGKKMK